MAAIGLCLIAAPLRAQAPAVPALPDSERRTQYSISASTCACSVGFALYGSGSDVDQWIEVWVAGTRYPSSDPSHGWSLSSATGPIATIARPITNAILTFNAAQTGLVQIVGAERPRRLIQAGENRGFSARDFNQAISDLVAVERELWDKTNAVTGRAILGLPGEALSPLPSASARAGLFLCWDGTGLKPLGCPPLNGSGNVAGPAGAIDGHVPVFSGSSGLVLRDSGAVPLIGVGTDTNTLNAQTANYALQTSDCGKTVTLGGSAFFTLTAGAASGFPAICSIAIANIDASRGKTITISGIAFPNGGILWPGQTFGLKNENNTWTLFGAPGRFRLAGGTVFFIDATNGNDANDGLASGAGAFATIKQFLTNVCANVDLNFNQVNGLIAVGTGPYAGVISCQYVGYNASFAYGQVTIQQTQTAVTTPVATPGVVNWTAHGLTAGDVVYLSTTGALPTGISVGIPYYVIAGGLTPNAFEVAATAGGSAINFTGSTSGTSLVVAPKKAQISGTAVGSAVAGVGIFATGVTPPFAFAGVQFTNCDSVCVYADSGGVLALATVDFAGVTGSHVEAILGGRIRMNGYSISGGAARHWLAGSGGGTIFTSGSFTVGISNTPAFSTAFAQSTSGGFLDLHGTIYVGSGATGTRYSCDTGGGIFTGNAGATFLPGNGAGSCTAPGWYN